jgi:DNA-binding transcriptional LysR family regulator
MLGRYRSLYPRVQLQLSESYTSGVAQSLNRGMLDAGFLRDAGPTEGLHVETLFSEPYVAVLSATHRLAGRSVISAGDLREEPFVFFAPMAGARAYEKPISLCEAHGFRPRVVQEAPQWLTILRLIGAGLGVSIGPACVRQISGPHVSCPALRGARVRSDIELAYRAGEDRAVVSAFARVARESFRTPSRRRTDAAAAVAPSITPSATPGKASRRRASR